MQRATVALALLLGGLLVGAPLAVMVAQSLAADLVETRDGRFLGQKTDSDENKVTIRVSGETEFRESSSRSPPTTTSCRCGRSSFAP